MKDVTSQTRTLILLDRALAQTGAEWTPPFSGARGEPSGPDRVCG
jgi:hypothetical protein